MKNTTKLQIQALFNEVLVDNIVLRTPQEEENIIKAILGFDVESVVQVLLEFLEQYDAYVRTFDVNRGDKVIRFMENLILHGRGKEIRSSLRDTPIKCNEVWLNAHVAYRCKDCGTSESSCMCVNCFNPDDHVGHNYRIYRSHSGGCCDCGDVNAWSKKTFCAKHRGVPSKAADASINGEMFRISSRIVFRACCAECLFCIYTLLGLDNHSHTARVTISMVQKTFEEYNHRAGEPVTKDIYVHQKEIFLLKMLNFLVDFGELNTVLHDEVRRALSYGKPSALEILMRFGIFLEIQVQEKIGVLFLKALANEDFKRQTFSPLFQRTYPFLTDMYLYSTESIKASAANFVDRILCQLCNNSEQVAVLVTGQKDDMLGIIMTRLEAILTKYAVAKTMEIIPRGPDGGFPPFHPELAMMNRVIECVPSGIQNTRFLERLLIDLHLLLCRNSIAECAIFDREDVLCSALEILYLLQELNSTPRKCDVHIDTDQFNVWRTALSIEVQFIMPAIRLARGYGRRVSEYNTSPLQCTTQKIVQWLEREGLVSSRFTNPISEQETSSLVATFVASYTHRISSPKYCTSMHIPLHRFWGAMMYQTLLALEPLTTLDNAFREDHHHEQMLSKYIDSTVLVPLLECFLAEHPLRIFVLVAQISTGAWVRNGSMISMENYVANGWHELGLDYDIFVIQVAASQMPGNMFVRMVAKRFEVCGMLEFDDLFQIHPSRSKSKTKRKELRNEKLTDAQLASLCESMLFFLGTIIHATTKLGLPAEEIMRRDVIHCLVSGRSLKQTYSTIESRMSDYLLETFNLESIVNKVSVFHPPTDSTGNEGHYELHPDLGTQEISRYYPYWSKEERQIAEENIHEQRLHGKRGKSKERNPLGIEFDSKTQVFQCMSNIPKNLLWNAELHGYVFRILHARVCNQPGDILAREGIVLESLKLFHQALQLCKMASSTAMCMTEIDDHNQSTNIDGTIVWKWNNPEIAESMAACSEMRHIANAAMNNRIDAIQHRVKLPFENPILNAIAFVPILKKSPMRDLDTQDGSLEEKNLSPSRNPETRPVIAFGSPSEWDWGTYAGSSRPKGLESPTLHGRHTADQPNCRSLPQSLCDIAPRSDCDESIGVSICMMLLHLQQDPSISSLLKRLLDEIVSMLIGLAVPVAPGIRAIFKVFHLDVDGAEKDSTTASPNKKLCSTAMARHQRRQAKIMARFAEQQAAFLTNADECIDIQAVEPEPEDVDALCVYCGIHEPTKAMGLPCYALRGSWSRTQQQLSRMDCVYTLGSTQEELQQRFGNSKCLKKEPSSVLIKGCGHLMHFECYGQYVSHLVHGEDHFLDSDQSEFRCPSCRSLANTLLPVVEDASEHSVATQAMVANFTETVDRIFYHDSPAAKWISIIAENAKLTSVNINHDITLPTTLDVYQRLVDFVTWYLWTVLLPQGLDPVRPVTMYRQDFVLEYISAILCRTEDMENATTRLVTKCVIATLQQSKDNKLLPQSLIHPETIRAADVWLQNYHLHTKTPDEDSVFDAALGMLCAMYGHEPDTYANILESIISSLQWEIQPVFIFLKCLKHSEDSMDGITPGSIDEVASRFDALREEDFRYHIGTVASYIVDYVTMMGSVENATIGDDTKDLLKYMLHQRMPKRYEYLPLVQLPEKYTDIFIRFCGNRGGGSDSDDGKAKTCPKCSTLLNADSTALCLQCGVLLCVSPKCKISNPVQRILYHHATSCQSSVSGSICPFLVVQVGVVFISFDASRSVLFGPLYLDAHGEEDPGLRRGKPLFLAPGRVAHLAKLVSGLNLFGDTKYLRKMTRVREED